MSSMGSLSNSNKLKELSIQPGAVFLGKWDGVDHEKFIVIAGVSEDRIVVCTVLINSNINPYIMRRQKMFDCQHYIKASNYGFLSHDSFVNCAQPVKGRVESFLEDGYKYCGILNDEDTLCVKDYIVNSGVLSKEDIQLFFKENIK